MNSNNLKKKSHNSTMSLKIDINLCRVCCQPKATHLIHKYAKKFQYCTSIEVDENDGLPNKICDQCLERMQIAVDFKRKSEFSDRQFKSFIANVNNQFLALEGAGKATDSDDEETHDDHEPGEEAVDSKPKIDTTMQKQEEVETISIERDGGEVEDVPLPDSEPDLELLPEQEQEKFRAVAVIQEKPAIKAEKEIYEMVEVDYEEDCHLQQDEMDIEEHVSNSQSQLIEESEIGEEAEDQEQVIFIGFATEYQDEEGSATTMTEDDEKSEKPYELSNASEVDHSYRQPNYATVATCNTSVSTPTEKPREKFECVECAKSFSTKTNLNRHLMSHNGNKPFVCLLCHKGFTQSGSLKQHLYIHQNIRPFMCEVCNQGFTQQKSLTFHMRRHTNEKPFVCPHCSYAFRQKDGLKRHMLVKHTEKDAKSFRCDVCERTFQSRYALSMHRKRQENGASGPCCKKAPSEAASEVYVQEEAEVMESDETVVHD